MTAYLNLLISPSGNPVEATVSRLPAHQLPAVRYRSGLHTHRQLLQLDGHPTLTDAHHAARELCQEWGLNHVLELLDNHTTA